MSKIYIVTRNQDQFRSFLKLQIPSMRGDFIHLRTTEQLQGTFDITVMTYGEYYKNSNHNSILEMVRQRKENDISIKSFRS